MAGIKITDLQEDFNINNEDFFIKSYGSQTFKTRGSTLNQRFSAVKTATNLGNGSNVFSSIYEDSTNGSTLFFNSVSGGQGLYSVNNNTTHTVNIGIAPYSIRNSMLAASSVNTANVIDGSITTEKIDPNNLVTASAWANFDGRAVVNAWAAPTTYFHPICGTNEGYWDRTTNWNSYEMGKYSIFPRLSGITVGGVDLRNQGILLTSFNGKRATFINLTGQWFTTREVLSGSATQTNGYGFYFKCNGIKNSYNVSDITKQVNGDYNVLLTRPLNNVDCAALATATNSLYATASAFSTSIIDVKSYNAAGTLTDTQHINFVLFGY